VLPRRIAERLQLPVIGRRSTAKGAAEFDECVGIVLVGATTLELGFEVDPAAGKLKEAATYLL
jgi:hypothetical protein